MVVPALARLCENSAPREMRKKRQSCNCICESFCAAGAKIVLYAIRPKVFTQSVTRRAASRFLNSSFRMTLRLQQLQHQTRRQFLRNVGQFSLGAIAMEALRATPLQAAAGNAHNPMAVRTPHFAPKVKRVIYL